MNTGKVEQNVKTLSIREEYESATTMEKLLNVYYRAKAEASSSVEALMVLNSIINRHLLDD